jgi:hypothetical protein
MADIAATVHALGLSERDIRAQQETLQKGFRGQPRHAASREADSKADIAATARDLGLSERDLLEQQSVYSGHTAAFESRPSSGRAPIPKHQTGDLNVTNESHVYDCKLAKKLLPPGTLPKEQQKALDLFLTLTVNLPVKTRSGPGGNFGSHPDSDNVLDTEIMNALGTRQPLSDGALARVRAKVALVKGMAKDAGLSDDSIKSLILPLVVLRGPNGTTVDERYPVVYENGKPVNIWKDQPSAETGLKDNGEPDLRTTKGRERAANAKTFAQDTGLTKDGQADERTKHGQHLGVPKAKMRAAFTGKKKDGTPDMRTKLGKQIEEARVHKQANVPVVESSSKSDESLSAQSTPQKKPPAHTLLSPSPCLVLLLLAKRSSLVATRRTILPRRLPLLLVVPRRLPLVARRAVGAVSLLRLLWEELAVLVWFVLVSRRWRLLLERLPLVPFPSLSVRRWLMPRPRPTMVLRRLRSRLTIWRSHSCSLGAGGRSKK